MTNTSFLQANINHCARAQDLLIQSMAEWLIEIAVVSEPYFVPPKDNWAGDNESSVAIIHKGYASSSPFEKVAKGSGCVAVLLGGVVIVGVYFSPNRVLTEFEQFLMTVGAFISRFLPRPVIVIGDLNAKSAAWGSPITDARGVILEEWALTTGLEILNRGSIYTCVR